VEFRCLSDAETETLVKTVPGWTLKKNSVTGDALFRSFQFEDFRSAFLFMSASAQLAEKNGHHPDWRNLYNTVDVTLTTDDKACLSTFDIEYAQGMDAVYAATQAKKL
jgi:4a-hydroxytetrahydrobiopterin dehydratase